MGDPNIATARTALRALVDALMPQKGDSGGAGHHGGARPTMPPQQRTDQSVSLLQQPSWFLAQGLGPLAHRVWGPHSPALAQSLADDAYAAAAESTVRLFELDRILAALQRERIPVVLLKGAALAEEVYGEPALRTMCDVDLWVPGEQIAHAAALMGELGYQAFAADDRPPALQRLSRGEIQFYSPHEPPGLVEVHWSPFPGWWLRYTGAVDDEAVWSRCEPLLVGGRGWAHRLEPADMIIQLAVHLALGSQFKPPAVRGLLDIALVARRYPVDWEAVADRARTWRVATLVWVALSLADALIGVPDAANALAALRPAAPRRRLLGYLVSPASILAGRDVTTGRTRFLLLLLLVDRPRAALRLAWRTVWPESEWLAARYDSASRRQHLETLVRQGRI